MKIRKVNRKGRCCYHEEYTLSCYLDLMLKLTFLADSNKGDKETNLTLILKQGF